MVAWKAEHVMSDSQEHPHASTSSDPPGGLLFHVCAAVLLYFFDALLLSQGAVAGIATFVMVLLGIVRVARGGGVAVVGRHIRSGFALTVIYPIMMASVVATIWANNRIARGRADEIVAALKLYRSENGDYPVRLAELVPRYMPVVPRAKYTFSFNEFDYHYDPRDHRGYLMYVALPPFGRPTYWLGRDAWGYLD